MNDLKGIIEDCNKSDLVSDKIIKKIIEIIGQEEWQDLHDENNDICTTMGELIITLKGISELERKLEQTEKDLADYQFNYPKIKELEKENAELKKESDFFHTEKGEYKSAFLKEVIKKNKIKKNLTKAIEFLNEFMRISKASDEDFEHDYSELIRETEQFIKGENIILEDAQAGNSPFDADEVFHKEMKTYPEEK